MFAFMLANTIMNYETLLKHKRKIQQKHMKCLVVCLDELFENV